MSSTVAPVIIAAVAKHTATLIFFHGLGDTGHGWASTIAAIRTPNMKVICPTAHAIPVSLNAGFRMPSWFDLKTLDISGPEDEAGIKAATKMVHEMITKEIQDGIPSNRIMLGGFSQGGALALYSALTFAEPLAGVMALSCWLPLHKSFPQSKKCPDTLPIYQSHGDCDPVLPYKFGQISSSFLKGFMKNAEFVTYRGLSHSSSDEEIADMKKFIEKHVPLTQ
uniref:palmitoyl-protein hydrolase n=1 Tax=Culicoides sonorensis TaxID=179676 RepID=A0A336K686_CULSO